MSLSITYAQISGLADRLGPVNDLLIALTARQMGATVVTSNLEEFRQIATRGLGLKIVAPEDPVLCWPIALCQSLSSWALAVLGWGSG